MFLFCYDEFGVNIMEIELNGKKREVFLLDKRYAALDGFFLVQIKFKTFVQNWELHYKMSVIIKETAIKEEHISIECVYSYTSYPRRFIASDWLVKKWGYLRFYQAFKEIIYELLEDELDKDEYAEYRLLLLPI